VPEPGFKSITVSDEFFDWFDAEYKKNKKCGTLNPGICSFASFFCEQLELAIKEHHAIRNFVSKIKYVPKEFTETKYIINKSKLSALFTKYEKQNH